MRAESPASLVLFRLENWVCVNKAHCNLAKEGRLSVLLDYSSVVNSCWNISAAFLAWNTLSIVLSVETICILHMYYIASCLTSPQKLILQQNKVQGYIFEWFQAILHWITKTISLKKIFRIGLNIGCFQELLVYIFNYFLFPKEIYFLSFLQTLSLLDSYNHGALCPRQGKEHKRYTKKEQICPYHLKGMIIQKWD